MKPTDHIRQLLLLLLIFAIARSATLFADGPAAADFQRRMAALASTPYTEAQWQVLIADLETARGKAHDRSDWQEAIALGLRQTRAYLDLRNDTDRALALLEKLKVLYAGKPAKNVRELFLTQGEIHAAQGNPQAITRLILEFRDNPNFDGRFDYQIAPDDGRTVLVTRPRMRGSESITVTALDKLRQQAKSGRGQRMPEITLLDQRGTPYRLDSLPWKITLVDFWLGPWVSWQRNLPYLVSAHNQYGRSGFGILGIALDRDPTAGLRFLKERGARWPQVIDYEISLPRHFGLYGEPANMLVDEYGNILARNIAGPDLIPLIRRALGLDQE